MHAPTMAAAATLPVLLPARSLPSQDAGTIGWQPKRNLEIPNPPPAEDPKALEMDMARQLADGKPVKKVRPRRTVDYGGAMGRWTLVSSNVLHVDGPSCTRRRMDEYQHCLLHLVLE